MHKYILFVLFMLSVVCSCKDSVHREITIPPPLPLRDRDTVIAKEHERNELSNNKAQKQLKPTAFDYPMQIEGCACYYSTDRAAFEAGKYIYADDFQMLALMKLDGHEFTMFRRDTTEKMQGKKHWLNEKYEIHIDLEQVGEMDETWQYEGILQIFNRQDSLLFETYLYGECGC